MTAKLTLTGMVILGITVLIFWGFGISLPNWLPLIDFFGTGDWSMLKSLLLLGAVLFGGGAIWGGYVYISEGGSVWSKRFFILSAVVGLSTLLGYVALTGTGLDALLYILDQKRDVRVQPLIDQADKLKAGEIKPEDIDLFGLFSGWMYLLAGTFGLALLGVILGTKDGRESLGKAVGPAILLVAVLGGLYLVSEFFDQQTVERNREAAAASVKTPTHEYRPSITSDDVVLTRADYLTDKIGRLPNLAVRAGVWSDPIFVPVGTCIDWDREDVIAGSRVGWEEKFQPGFVTGFTQVAFKARSGSFPLQLERKTPGGSCQ